MSSFRAPSPSPSDIVADGSGSLFISDLGDFGAGMLYEIDRSGTAILSSFPLPFRGGAIAFDGTDLYVGDNDSGLMLVVDRSRTAQDEFYELSPPAWCRPDSKLCGSSASSTAYLADHSRWHLLRLAGPRRPGAQGLGASPVVGPSPEARPRAAGRTRHRFSSTPARCRVIPARRQPASYNVRVSPRRADRGRRLDGGHARDSASSGDRWIPACCRVSSSTEARRESFRPALPLEIRVLGFLATVPRSGVRAIEPSSVRPTPLSDDARCLSEGNSGSASGGSSVHLHASPHARGARIVAGARCHRRAARRPWAGPRRTARSQQLRRSRGTTGCEYARRAGAIGPSREKGRAPRRSQGKLGMKLALLAGCWALLLFAVLNTAASALVVLAADHRTRWRPGHPRDVLLARTPRDALHLARRAGLLTDVRDPEPRMSRAVSISLALGAGSGS